ncbi:MAG: hypothetical protein U5Q03_20405 [Bacteroidota bacterium]|nr:hypothetical protein [Bacteroidota bacterium]
MLNRHGQDHYNRLRKDYPVLVYEDIRIERDAAGLHIGFSFRLNEELCFRPELSFPVRDFYSLYNIRKEKLELLAFNLGMTEMISYWKATCSPGIVIKTGQLDEWQQEWWKKLFYKGLGEFFHTNGIVPEYDDFLSFQIESDKKLRSFGGFQGDEVILPVGGGKDSIVSLEILGRHQREIRPFVINPAEVHRKVLGIAGYPEDQWIVTKRKIDPLLLKLNEQGFLNGHTPFSAIVAFLALFGAVLSGNPYIALSNESSANEPTIPDTGVNHQYSKSVEFESDFRNYAGRYISDDIEYFSLLRPLNELQIARIFSGLDHYHLDFRSCNAGSKQGVWCGKCSKCLFTWVILSAFLPLEKLKQVYGKNLFEDADLLEILWQLTGDAAEKPFECVGTMDEVNAALEKSIQLSGRKLPLLLAEYKKRKDQGKGTDGGFEKLLQNYDADNFLKPVFEKMIMEAIQWKD